MAGTGKGVLRIAIEDFLGTFDPTSMFDKAIGNIARYLVDNTFAPYLSLAEEIADTSKIQALIEVIHTHSTQGQTMSKAVFFIFMMFALITSMGNAYFAPFGQQVTYTANAKALPGRLALGDLIQLARKDPNEFARRKRTLSELGYTDDIFSGIDKANKNEIDLSLLIALYWRGEISEGEFSNRLKAAGMNEDRSKDIIKAVAVIPNVGDLIRMAVREAFSPDVVQRFNYGEAFPEAVLEFTKKQGLSDDWVKRYWYAHWELPSPTQGYEMLHRLRKGRTETTFDENDLDLLLRTADYAPYFRERMKLISYQPITRVDIRRIYKLGIIDAKEVKERYMDIGYNDKDAGVLADFTVKYEDAQGNDKRDTYKDLSFSVLRSLYQKGKISESDLKTRLSAMKYDDIEVGLIVDYFNLATVDSTSVDYRAQFIAEMVKYTSDAYQLEMINKGQAQQTLQAVGLTEASIEYILQKADYVAKLDLLNTTLKKIHDSYVNGGLSRSEMVGELGKLGISGTQQNKVIEEMELDLKYPNRRLTEAQYRAATIRGFITLDDYKANMLALGYVQKDVDLLVQLYFPTGG